MAQQPFPAPQGIPQHPGLPPHPMGPGHHPNAAPPGGMVQQMHPGVSAPGGPHVSQAGPMLGMPPGAGTTGPGGPMANAHALSHLGPAQAHLFQQPQFAQTCMLFHALSPPSSLSLSFSTLLSCLLRLFKDFDNRAMHVSNHAEHSQNADSMNETCY